MTRSFLLAGRCAGGVLPLKTHNQRMREMEGSTSRQFCTAAFPLLVAGCGLQTPDLQSPFSNPADLHMTIDHIMNEVKCELAHGILRAIARDDDLAEKEKQEKQGSIEF